MSAPCSRCARALVTAKNSSLPVHHLPVGVDPDAAQQRDVGGEQLGDAAAVRGGVQVEHPRALQRLGEGPDPVDHVDADHARVVVEVLLEQGDTIEHGDSGGAAGTGISVNLSSDGLRTGVPRQVPGHARRGRGRGGDGRGLRRAGFDDVTELPLADGGDGTLDALLAARGGSRRHATVTGPLGDPVDAEWALLPGGVAVVEMARASGLALVPTDRNDPLRASTRGTGELIAAAIRAGARRVIVGVGGSATTDGGLAALEALGWSLGATPVTVACDVSTRFLDAARVFGPQKGATDAQVALLTRRLAQLADEYEQRTGVDVRELPGARRRRWARRRSGRDRRRARAGLRRGRRRGRARSRRSTASSSSSPARASSTPPASRARSSAGCSSGRPTPACRTSR